MKIDEVPQVLQVRAVLIVRSSIEYELVNLQ
jgi:hypothetical protein